MKATIDVKDRREADLLRQALADPEVRAMALVVGALFPLSQRGRERVLTFYSDMTAEQLQMKSTTAARINPAASNT